MQARSDLSIAKRRNLTQRNDTIAEATIADVCLSDLGGLLAKIANLSFELELQDNESACTKTITLCNDLNRSITLYKQRISKLKKDIQETRKSEPTKRGNPNFKKSQ